MKKILTLVMACVLAIGISVPAFAANESYSFTVENTGTNFTTYTGAYNTKSYVNDASTIKCTYTNAPGYGFRSLLQYKSLFTYYNATDGVWFTTSEGTNSTTKHPTYLENCAVKDRKYYVAGRIDSDYTGTYSCTGLFNSDYTNP